MPGSTFKSLTAETPIRIAIGAALFAGAVWLALVWRSFHPHRATPMAGPAGATHRAFFENVGFQDAGHVLCASDWPHTLTMPVSLGEVPSSESCTSHVFWSIDGSVLTVRDRGEFRCAYDYREHEKIEYEPDRIEKLITSRGGLGPEYADYPDSKGEAPAPPLWPWLSGGLLLLLLLLFALRPHRARRRN